MWNGVADESARRCRFCRRSSLACRRAWFCACSLHVAHARLLQSQLQVFKPIVRMRFGCASTVRILGCKLADRMTVGGNKASKKASRWRVTSQQASKVRWQASDQAHVRCTLPPLCFPATGQMVDLGGLGGLSSSNNRPAIPSSCK